MISAQGFGGARGSSSTASSSRGVSSNPGMLTRDGHSGFSATLHQVDQQLQAILRQVADLVAQLQTRQRGQADTGAQGGPLGGPASGGGSPSGGTAQQAPTPTGISDATQAGQPLLRLLEPAYADGKSAMAGSDRPSAREISNVVMAQDGSRPNSKGLSDLFWQWGQFIDHDLTSVPTDTGQPVPITVPIGDPQLDPASTGSKTIPFNRSVGTADASGVRQQTNSITGLLDASMVYGSTAEQTAGLRGMSGGRLSMSAGQMMPENGQGGFVAGDSRVNEQPGLAAMHNLWVREHNRIADDLAIRNPCWSDEQIFDAARRLVTAEIQHITYEEWLPELLGEAALPAYQGYDPTVNPQVTNEFAGAAFRLGHTMLSPTLLQLDESGQPIGDGLSLREQFGNPMAIENGGMDTILRGMANQRAQEFDELVIDDVRSFLFTGDNGGLDLASLNTQRGRDQGLPTLNDAREQLGLSRITSFDDSAFREGAGAKLAQVYGGPDEVDLWVGGLAESAQGDGLAGPTFRAILVDQFTRSRDGNAMWYETLLSDSELLQVDGTTLAKVIERNTSVGEVQDQAFRVPDAQLATEPTPQEQQYDMPLAGLSIQSSKLDQARRMMDEIRPMPFPTDVRALWRTDRFQYRGRPHGNRGF